jgi:S-adenosyl-L-methionine hydrolase (adenosine-forming)
MPRLLLRLRFPLVLAALLFAAGCANRPSDDARKKEADPRTIVFMSDFGTANDSVAICKAVMLGIAPDARIMDITQQVTPYSIEEGARFLADVTPYYPAGTIFLAVIDPGVGTSRKAVIVKTRKGQFFVLPDNGLITPVADRDGIEAAREITNPAWMIGDTISSTFHGRDIFSPAAAHLAAGEDWTLAGPEVRQLVRLSPRVATVDKQGIKGAVIGLDDPFGSLITNISGADFRRLGYRLGEKVNVRIDRDFYAIPYVATFMDVPVGEPLLYVNSRGFVGVALNQGNFAAKHKLTPPLPIFIPRKGE